MADHVRDIMDPDFILFLDSDEIILCDSADDLVRDFDAIPPGQVGALPWVTFVPKPNLKRAPFNPGNFRERLTSEFQQFYKIVLPRGAPLAPGNGISDGAHLAIGLDHKPIEQHRLSEAALAHVPARNRDQVVERAFFSLASKSIAEKADPFEAGSVRYRAVMNRLEKGEKGDWPIYLPMYCLYDKVVPRDEAVAADDRLPLIDLAYADQIRFKSYDLPNTFQRLASNHIVRSNPLSVLQNRASLSITDQDSANAGPARPAGAFAPELHASALKCDWPPIEGVLHRWRPQNVLDIGCGLGAYLRLCREQGARVLGADGADWSDYCFLSPSEYISCDLAKGAPPIEEKFDLSICLETLEHLPESAGIEIVDQLASLTSTAIIFSAAQPDQPGNGHITNRPAGFWLELFRQRGWSVDTGATLGARLLASLHWFRRNMFVLRPTQVCDHDPVVFERILSNSVHRFPWLAHAEGETMIGYPGQVSTYRILDNRPVPPIPTYKNAKNQNNIIDIDYEVDPMERLSLANTQIKEFKMLLAKAHQDATQHRESIEALTHSTSWRITAPIRKIKSLLQR